VTPEQRLARSARAQAAWDEFFAPMFDECEGEYTARIVEVANTELSRDKRTDKITALSHALKITKTLRAGMQEIVRDGELANAEKLKAQKIEQMTAPQRRLLSMGPQR
jgi:hypothetical protein